MNLRIIETKYVQFESTDKLLLPGMLFEPKKKTDKVAINLHGNGSASAFYSFDRANAFAKSLNQRGISFFNFNNRGAHYIHKLRINNKQNKDEIKIGTSLEIIRDCIKDIDGAINFLRELGYKEFYLIGHSTGANKICVYNYYKPKNEVSKYVLAGGGDDTGILMDWMGGPRKLKSYLEKAKKEIEKGNGKKMIPKYIINYMLSYQSFYDICDPDGDYNTFPFNEFMNNLKLSTKPLFREFKSIEKPTLVIYGENDEYCYGDVNKVVNILKKEASNKRYLDSRVIKDADHGFHNHEEEIAEIIANWLTV